MTTDSERLTGAITERTAALKFIRARADSTRTLVERGRLSAADGSNLTRWLAALADDIAAGLHVEGD